MEQPLATSISPSQVPLPYANVTVTVTGENFVPPLTVTVGEVPVTPTEATTQTLAFALPAGLGAGRYPVTVRNGAGLSASVLLQVGTPLYLPVVTRH